MHEKTLLIGALAATALAAGFGVYKAHEMPEAIEIAPVSRLDSARPVRSVEVPVRLTASDGTGLRLVSLRASSALEDPLAFTEIHLVFENPEDRELEGTFAIALPQRASVSRFAMKIGNAWQEGEVVERQQARAAYEDFLHRKQDPALLEQAAGNEFSARVFPIPARGTKELVVTYTETLEAGAPYVLSLKGLAALASLDVDVYAGGSARNARFGLHQQNVAPADDFVVDASMLPRSAGLRSGELIVTRVVPFATSRPDPIESAVVLVDSSASRALGMVEQARLVQLVLARLRPDARVTVACFDQEVAPIYEGTAGGFGEQAVKAIVDRGALGASDFQRALAWAGEAAKQKNLRRVVVIGDGVATAGETDGQRIKLEVEKLRSAKVDRIDAIAVGGIRDEAFLRSLVRGVLDRDGVVLDARIGAGGLAQRLGEATSSGIAVKVDGASWSWPRTLDGLQAGDEVLIHAEVPAGTPIRVDIGGQEFTPDLRTAAHPLVERDWAQAKIESLVEAPTSDPATTRREIVALGTRHRIVSPHTAMLVLEHDADYERFGIDRQANREILAVQEGRIAVVREPRQDLPPMAGAEKRRDNEAPPEERAEVAKEEVARNEITPQAPPPPATATATAPPVVPAPPVAKTPMPVPTPAPAPTLPTKSERHASKPPASRPAPRPAEPPPPPMPATKPKPSTDDETKKAIEALQKAQLDGDSVFERPATVVVPTAPAKAAAVAAPYEGRFKVVMDLIAQGKKDAALAEAIAWHTEQPGDVMALVALGEAFEACGDLHSAARAYGSILELHPSRADSRRFAGERLERLADPAALRLAIDSFAKAVLQRPDHPSGHRLYAFALLR
ncbi:MAG: hypothetical protein K0S65_327, partial [Labilithrix sp.]|nr:hypothetical protein [Labilithrix sp.]